MMTLCDQCNRAARYTIPAYWGATLCPPCARRAAHQHDTNRTWPPTPWPDDKDAA